MVFGELNIDIKDYLGRIGPGVTVILSIIFNDKAYQRCFEGIYWYTDDLYILQIPEEIEKEIGIIEDHIEYPNIMKFLLDTNPPYIEIATDLEDILETSNVNKDHPPSTNP